MRLDDIALVDTLNGYLEAVGLYKDQQPALVRLLASYKDILTTRPAPDRPGWYMPTIAQIGSETVLGTPRYYTEQDVMRLKRSGGAMTYHRLLDDLFEGKIT